MTVRRLNSLPAFVLSAALAAVSANAQHAGHQMPGQPAPESAEAALDVCREQARQIVVTLDRLAARLEAARQVNSGPDMRAAMDDVQLKIGELKTAATACAPESGPSAHEGYQMAGAATAPSPPPRGRSAQRGAEMPAPATALRVVVTDAGFEPATLALKKGEPARITFVRTSDRTCGTEVVFPELGIRRALPLNEPVDVDLTPARSGEMTFTCGMAMLKGTILAR